MTHAQVEAIAEACARPSDVSKHRRLDERENQTYRLVVLFLAYTGVRFGEMAALRVSRLDLTRRRATIAESVTVVQGEGLVWGTPKSHERRQVPIPRFLVAELREHIAGKEPDDLVFTGVRGGGPLRAPIFRAGFHLAAKAIGIPELHPLSRPGAQCRCCHRSGSPGRSPNPSCQFLGNGLSTVAAVRRDSWVARG